MTDKDKNGSQLGALTAGANRVLNKSEGRTRYALKREHTKALNKASAEVNSKIDKKVKALDDKCNSEKLSHSYYKRISRRYERQRKRNLATAKTMIDENHYVPDIEDPHFRFQDEALKLLITSILEGKSNKEAYKELREKRITQERFDAYQKKWTRGEFDLIDKKFISVAKGRYPASWITFDRPLGLIPSNIAKELEKSGLFPKYSHEYYKKGKVSEVMVKLSNLYKSVKALRENRLLVASNKQKELAISALELKLTQLQSEIKDPNGWHKMIEDGLNENEKRKTVIALVQSQYDIDKTVVINRWDYQKRKNAKE